MHIAEITRARFSEWRRMREELYRGLDAAFHDQEMELIFCSAEAACFLGMTESGEPVAMLEVSLRNFVDGCLGSPIGYIEGIYVAPDLRDDGHGRELVQFAAQWFRSKGCRDMAADAELENFAAQQFLTRAGFVETFRIVEFKRSLGET
jgi:aminoglycoside 6'-N-acetyltransferase I